MIGDLLPPWFLALFMRRLCQFGMFLLLAMGIFFLWQNRFERSDEHPVFTLADLRPSSKLAAGSRWIDNPAGPVLLLKADDQHRNIVARMSFPALGPVDFLRVRYVVGSRDLRPGKEPWDDGRGIIEWHSPAGGESPENDPIFSTRHDHEGKPVELVMRPRHGPAVPVLRLEHLGSTGDFEIRGLEAVVLRERWIWQPGRWLLMAGWVAWFFSWLHPVGRTRRAATLVVAVGWLFMGLYFVVPGPWKPLRPLVVPFNINGQSAPASKQVTPVNPVSLAKPEALRPVGEIPQNGDFTLTVKLLVAQSKWILHVGLLFLPTLLTACLVGRKQAFTLAIAFSLAVELAQIAFGYGTDLTDLVDLAADVGGILLALVVHRRLVSKVFTRGKASSFFAET